MEYCTTKVIQCDNGGEFKGPFESLLLKHRIKENNKPSISPGVAEQMREVAQYIEKETWIPEKFEKGSNWVLDLQIVVHSINAFPMEVLRNQNPFEIFFGRQHEKHTPLPNLSEMKQRDRKSTARCVQRMNECVKAFNV